MEKNLLNQNNILSETFGLQKRWINWKYEIVNGIKTKVPYQINGIKASTVDPLTWSTYKEIIEASQNMGIVFMPDQLLLGIDLDHCLNENIIVHEQKESIAQLVIEANSYTEISPSGTGLHLYLSLTAPLKLIANKHEPYECYTSGRYFTVTNNPYKEALPIRTVTPEEAINLLSIIGYPWGKKEIQQNIAIPTTISFDDETILSKMFSSKNGDKIKTLYNGDISAYNNDDSSADMALCSHLAFWTGCNIEQMERMWLVSPLGAREKTQERKDYRDRTINTAIQGCTETYKLKEIEEESKEPVKILTFLELINKEFQEIPWDVEGIFESGTINMISAPPNQYKSWVVQHVAFCLAQSKDVFGHFKTKNQNTLIINEEDNLRMIKDRSLKMVESMGNLGVYFMVGSGFKIDKDSVIDICIKARERNISFIIFDSLRSVHNANENDSQEMQKVMDYFKYLTREGFTVLFTHHNRKKDKFSNKSDNLGEESRGSTAINAGVHGHLSCEEIIKEDGKYLLISQRKLKCDEKLKPFLVKIEIDKENNKINFNYQGEYDAKEETFRKNKDFALRTIENSDKWLCKKEISVFMGLTESTLSKVLQELEKEKLVQSKTTKELNKLNIQINDPSLKSNAKFYFKNEVVDLNQFITDLQSDDGF
jgi:archaellum biogenesis ATPase FlaH